MTAHTADRGPRSIRIYTADDRPRLVATLRLADFGTADEVLRAHGWHRATPWLTASDVPDDHALAVVERLPGRTPKGTT